MEYYYELLQRDYRKYIDLLGFPEDKKQITDENLTWVLENANPIAPKPYFHLGQWAGFTEALIQTVKKLQYWRREVEKRRE